MGHRITDLNKYQREREIVERFLHTVRVNGFTLDDPNEGGKRESGADVRVLCGGRKYGIQVTEFHADEGRSPISKGSRLRSDEARQATTDRLGWIWLPIDPMPALKSRIAAKVQKAHSYDRRDFEEVSLLVACQVPAIDAVASTALLPGQVNLDVLARYISPMLDGSKLTEAFIYAMMSPAVFRWTRRAGWDRL
jgi:hypothetical protein